jgi:hypothetical protein
LKHLSRIDNAVDNRCFACQQLNENTEHVFRCNSERRQEAREEAMREFKNHLSRLYTPAPMATVILDMMWKWMKKETLIHVRLPENEEATREIHQLINRAAVHQGYIGWGHWFRGRISKKWKDVIAYHYRERQLGSQYNPTIWTRKTVDQQWTFYLTIWHCRNGQKYGKDKEEAAKLAMEAAQQSVRTLYQNSQHQVMNQEARLLHRLPISEILKWTKSHLDAYLATAEVILEQNVDPG